MEFYNTACVPASNALGTGDASFKRVLGSAEVTLPDDAPKRCIYYPHCRSSDGAPRAATDTRKDGAQPVPPGNEHDGGVAVDPRRERTQIRKVSRSPRKVLHLKRVENVERDRIDPWQGVRGNQVRHAQDDDLA